MFFFLLNINKVKFKKEHLLTVANRILLLVTFLFKSINLAVFESIR